MIEMKPRWSRRTVTGTVLALVLSGALAAHGALAQDATEKPDMAALLTDTNVHVRALAAQCLGRLGAGARPYLPPLRALQADPDARCRENAAAAIQAIEKTGRP